MAERLDGWTCTPETPSSSPPPTPPPMTAVAGFVPGSELKFKFTIKHVNSQLVYIRPVGLIINLVMIIRIIIRCKCFFLFIGRQPTM